MLQKFIFPTLWIISCKICWGWKTWKKMCLWESTLLMFLLLALQHWLISLPHILIDSTFCNLMDSWTWIITADQANSNHPEHSSFGRISAVFKSRWMSCLWTRTHCSSSSKSMSSEIMAKVITAWQHLSLTVPQTPSDYWLPSNAFSFGLIPKYIFGVHTFGDRVVYVGEGSIYSFTSIFMHRKGDQTLSSGFLQFRLTCHFCCSAGRSCGELISVYSVSALECKTFCAW